MDLGTWNLRRDSGERPTALYNTKADLTGMKGIKGIKTG